jgi:ribosomal protein S18 acetylase RimI-like enzyme
VTTPLLPDHLLARPDGAPDDVVFRLIQEADWQPLRAACYPDKSLAQFRQHFAQIWNWQMNGRAHWIIATNPTGQIIGSGQLVLYPHGSELANLAVIPARQNEGIGTALIAILTTVARHLDLTYLEIGVAASNGRALDLYQRLGFTI